MSAAAESRRLVIMINLGSENAERAQTGARKPDTACEPVNGGLR